MPDGDHADGAFRVVNAVIDQEWRHRHPAHGPGRIPATLVDRVAVRQQFKLSTASTNSAAIEVAFCGESRSMYWWIDARSAAARAEKRMR